MSKHIRPALSLLCVLSLLWGCSTDRLMKKESAAIERETSQVTPPVPREIPEPAPPVLQEKPSPLAGRTITLSADNASFTDIFSAIAEVGGLDLVIDSRLMGRGSAPQDYAGRATNSGAKKTAASEPAQADPPSTGELQTSGAPILLRPVSVAFNKTPLTEAIENLTDSLNVFAEVRGNCLYVRGTSSRTYHLNFISSQKQTMISIGGDVLGGASGGEGGGNSSSPLSGRFSIQDTNPTSSSDIYAQIEQIVKSSLTEHGSFSLNRAIGFLEINDRKNAVERIDSYIKTIKTYYNSQVLITAKILEVSLNDSSKYGIDWTSIHGTIGDYAFNPISQHLALSTDNLTPSLEIKVSSGKHGIEAALNALQEFGDIKVLSNPRIRVTNGQPALISVGTNSSYVQKIERTTTISEGVRDIETEVTIASAFDGIMFGVQPFIDLETNRINLTITPIKSRIVKLEEKVIDEGFFTLPTIDLKEATTQLRVKSGDVVVLGGLISKGLSNQTKSIPILGNIPLIGYLFSQKIKTVDTQELVILLEPVIIEQ